VGAERRALGSVCRTMILVDQHVAALAFGADVLAVILNCDAGFGGHCLAFRGIEVMEVMKHRCNEGEEKADPSSSRDDKEICGGTSPPPCFCKELTGQGLGGGGRIKNCGKRS